MKQFLLTLLLQVFFCQFAESKTKDTPSLEKIADSIRKEGLSIYSSERASWFGTDLFLEKFKGERSEIGGYFSYLEGNIAKCVFYSANGEKIIGTITFNDILTSTHGNVDLTNREFSKREKEYRALRDAVTKLSREDTMFKFYQNTTLNVVPLIDDNGKRVYCITGTNQSGVIPFGNDYLIRFKEDVIVSKEAIHKTLIPVSNNEVNTSAASVPTIIHSHLPGFSLYMTPTDICTAMLYGPYFQVESFVTVSEKYISIWDAKHLKLHILDKPEK